MTKHYLNQFPSFRGRRMRQSENLRRLVRETRLHGDQLVMPYFVREGRAVREPIVSMPAQYRFSPDALIGELEELEASGVHTVLLFGLPSQKDAQGSEAWKADGIVQKTVRHIKKRFSKLTVITDVCLCAYTTHGHCGLLNKRGEVANDESARLIGDIAVSHAEAGADIVAPSDMMDGRVHFVRKALDCHGFEHIPIMSYAAKYASSFYGPFREAADSAPQEIHLEGGGIVPSDRKSYQMDPPNAEEALRELAMDIQEGADIVMVKPALAYLDVICKAVQTFSVPVAAYQVSGEYAMVKAAAEQGFLKEKEAVLELLTACTRAGAKILITYYAKQIGFWLQEEQPQAYQQVTAS